MLSPEQNFRPLSNTDLETTYMAEIRALDAVTKLPDFQEILGDILNYRTFLESRRQDVGTVDEILEATTGGKSIIEASRMSPAARRIISTAHLAASSILLENFRFSLKKLGSDQLVTEMQEYITSPRATEPGNALSIMQKLHGMDAVRIMQLQRIFGFVTRKSEEMLQLGIGSANGSKDIDYAHTEPFNFLETGSDGDEIKFSCLKRKAADIIISDLDPRYATLYQKFLMDPSSGISGYVSDVYDLLDWLAEKSIPKRNLVTMFRVEPAMLPDIGGFFRRLQAIMAESCDLVLSIGAGDSPEAYSERVGLISDMYDYLGEAGFKPVLTRLHLGGTVMQQAASLQFGNAATASYEILYCRLDPGKMENAFST